MGKERCSRCQTGSRDRQSWRHVCNLTCYLPVRSVRHKGSPGTVTYLRGCANHIVVWLEKWRCLVCHSLAIRQVHFNTNTRHPERLQDMAQQRDEVIDKMRAYSKDAKDLRDDPMELDASDTETRLAQTVRELQARVEEQQAALETVWHRPHSVERFLMLEPASSTV